MTLRAATAMSHARSYPTSVARASALPDCRRYYNEDRFPHGPHPALLDDAVGYLHLDVDVLDPSVGRANYLPVPGGPSVVQLTGAIASLRRQVPLAAAAVASSAPESDTDGGVCRAACTAGAMLTEISP